jgi:hypothetical protein
MGQEVSRRRLSARTIALVGAAALVWSVLAAVGASADFRHKLVIASITDEATGLPVVIKDTTFAVRVLHQDANGETHPTRDDTPVTLAVQGGTGVLGGTTTQTIPAGGTEVTFTGLTYSAIENVDLCASAAKTIPDCALLSVQSVADTFEESAGAVLVDTCTETTPENPKCVTVNFHNGVGSDGFLSEGSCQNFPGLTDLTNCVSSDSLASLIGNFKDPVTGLPLYTRTDPLTVFFEWDKSISHRKGAPDTGVPHFVLQVQTEEGGPFVDSPDCPEKGVIGADQEFCTDYVQSHREGGDLILVLLFAVDPRWK